MSDRTDTLVRRLARRDVLLSAIGGLGLLWLAGLVYAQAPAQYIGATALVCVMLACVTVIGANVARWQDNEACRAAVPPPAPAPPRTSSDWTDAEAVLRRDVYAACLAAKRAGMADFDIARALRAEADGVDLVGVRA